MKTGIKRNIIYSLVGAAITTALIGSGLIKRPDKWVQDALFQRGSVSSNDIIIIGIDDDALDRLGPYYSWDRNIMASALEKLASDPDKRPAVVAIDTLYASTTTPEADERLAAAAEELGCVITGTVAEYGTSQFFSDNGEVVTNNYSVLSYEEPFEALRDVTTQGHINAMVDIDGIMRHALLYVEPADENGNTRRVYSMPCEVARKFLETQGDTLEYPTVNSRGQFYIPFFSKPGGFYDGFNIADLIDGKIPSDYYAGKIVLIGPYAVGLQDAYFTPIERSRQMYGIEIQANVIQGLIEHTFRQEAPDLPQLCVLFVISALCMYLFLSWKFAPATIVGILVSGLAVVASYFNAEAGYQTHPIWIPASVLSLLLVAVVVHYWREAVERAKVYNTFERYVAPSVVKEILKEGTDALELGGKNVDIAVLFVDVRGFTTMSERLEPEKVVYILNKILTMTSSCIEKNGGTLDKFVGDATMAFWGAPFPQEDSVYLASKTALDIVHGCEQVAAQLREETGEDFKVGVGVHYGPAVVGNIGSERRMDYTAIGDTVNTAARLEANAPGSTVYISRVVADKLGSLAKTKSLGDSVKLKGKAEGFEVLILESLEEK